MRIRIRWIWLVVCCVSCSEVLTEKEAALKADWSYKIGLTEETDPYKRMLGDSLIHTPELFPEANFVRSSNSFNTRVSLPQKDSAYFELYISEVNEIISVVNLDIYLQDSAQSELVFNDLKRYYNGQHESGGETADYLVWYEGKDVEISLIDESENYGKPYIAVIYFKEEGIAD